MGYWPLIKHLLTYNLKGGLTNNLSNFCIINEECLMDVLQYIDKQDNFECVKINTFQSNGSILIAVALHYVM
jgi:hypothetical protein